MTFFISALVSARDSHINPDSEVGRLIWVEGWYQGRYGKFHVIIYLSHILHWLFSSIDFSIAEKIFEITNCENRSLRDLPLFNLQKKICFESVFKKILNNVDLYNDVRKTLKSTQNVDIWMEIPIQHDVYMWANYSISIYLNFIPIFGTC